MIHNSNTPNLVEPGIKYFLNETLKNCNVLKQQYYSVVFNFTVIVVFLTILGGILYYRYKGKLTPREKQRRDIEKQKYIMSMIRNYHVSKKKGQITGLPEFSHVNDIIY